MENISKKLSCERIGYLTADEDYARGVVSELLFERLITLVKHPFMVSPGYHKCDLEACGSKQPPPELRYKGVVIPSRGYSDILVFGKTGIYQAPALILHYIRAHNYLPPSLFLDAVLECPHPTSPEYHELGNKFRASLPTIPHWALINPSPMVVTKGRTIVAFACPISDDESRKETDANEVLAKLRLDTIRARETLQSVGIEFHERYTHMLRVRRENGLAVIPTTGVGYCFAVPDKRLRIEFGPMNDADLLRVANEYFGRLDGGQ